jgi:hypothetical protein
MAASRRFHRSTFFTGCFCEVFQPRRIQPSIQWSLKAFTTYWESECSSTLHGLVSASSAAIAPMSSMRLFVVR